MMPSDLPPMEIIDSLEEQLGMDFVHFTIDREGIVEGIFSNGFESQTVTFEVKREVTPSFKMPPIESILGELDEKAIADMKKMMNSIIEEIGNIENAESEELVKLDDSGYLPEFDGEWYCP
jgi:predicted nucleotide-binding protein (sugar kinase/HSP70/actin superfamily)